MKEAISFFSATPRLVQKLKVLNDVGLGYLRLGQSATTLSGGEAQRVKLAAHLSQATSEGTLYIFDEPTTGLHFDDIAKLLDAFERLLRSGGSILIIEHNLEVIRARGLGDRPGPEGGDRGGRIVAEGTPEQIAEVAESILVKLLASEIGMSFRVALRSLARSPGFTLIAVVTLMLGIGAVKRDVFGGQRRASETTGRRGDGANSPAFRNDCRTGFGFARMRTYRGMARSSATIFDSHRSAAILQPQSDRPRRAATIARAVRHRELVRHLAFTRLCWARTFAADEDQPGRAQVRGVRVRLLDGDDSVAIRASIGRTITLDQKPYIVIGVMPKDFLRSGRVAICICRGCSPQNESTAVEVMARLRPGVSIEQARAAMAVCACEPGARNSVRV